MVIETPEKEFDSLSYYLEFIKLDDDEPVKQKTKKSLDSMGISQEEHDYILHELHEAAKATLKEEKIQPVDGAKQNAPSK